MRPIEVGDTVCLTAEAKARYAALRAIGPEPGIVARAQPPHVWVRWLGGRESLMLFPAYLERAPDFINPHSDISHLQRPPRECFILADWLREQGYPGCAVRVLSTAGRRAAVLRAVAARGIEGRAFAMVCGWKPPEVLVGVDHGTREPKPATLTLRTADGRGAVFNVSVDTTQFEAALREVGRAAEAAAEAMGRFAAPRRTIRTGNATGKSNAVLRELAEMAGWQAEQVSGTEGVTVTRITAQARYANNIRPQRTRPTNRREWWNR